MHPLNRADVFYSPHITLPSVPGRPEWAHHLPANNRPQDPREKIRGRWSSRRLATSATSDKGPVKSPQLKSFDFTLRRSRPTSL